MPMDSQVFGTTVGTTDTRILGANQKRRALTISPPTAGRVTISFNATAVLDQGITIQAGTVPQTYLIEQVGDAIRGEVHAIGDAAGRTIGGVELFDAKA